MRVWNVTIKNFHKGRYFNQEKTLTVKAGRAHVAAYRAAKAYLDQLPKGTRIEGLNIRIEAYRPKKGIQPGLAQAAQDFLNRG